MNPRSQPSSTRPLASGASRRRKGGAQQTVRHYRWIAVIGLALCIVAQMLWQWTAHDGPESHDDVAQVQLIAAESQRIDLLVINGEYGDAIEALEHLRAHTPPAVSHSHTAIMLRHDVYGRLLDLRMEHPEIDPRPPLLLLAVADEGLGPAVSEMHANPFTARLFALRGRVLELLDEPEAALADYERALEINEVLLAAEISGEAS